MRRLTTVVNLLVTQTIFGRARSSHLSSHICPTPRLTSSFLSRSVSSSGVCLLMAKIKTMEEWNFSESKLASLPLDKETKNFTRQVKISFTFF